MKIITKQELVKMSDVEKCKMMKDIINKKTIYQEVNNASNNTNCTKFK